MSDPISMIGGVGETAINLWNSGTQSAETGAQLQTQEAQAQAGIATYQNYLNAFPQYASLEQQNYSQEAARVLGGQLASFAGSGASPMQGKSGATSTSEIANTGKSLWDQGYITLTNQLNQKQSEAEQQLNVYKTTLSDLQSEEQANKNSFGGILNSIGNDISTGINDVVNWIGSLF